MGKNVSTVVPVEAIILAAIVILLMVLMAFPAEAKAVQARPSTSFNQGDLSLPPGVERVPAIYLPDQGQVVDAQAEVEGADTIGWVVTIFLVLGALGYVVFLVLHPWRFPACPGAPMPERGEEDLHSWGHREERAKCAMPGPMQDTLNRRQ